MAALANLPLTIEETPRSIVTVRRLCRLTLLCGMSVFFGLFLKHVAPNTAKLELLSYLHRQTLVGSVHGQVRGRASLSLTLVSD